MYDLNQPKATLNVMTRIYKMTGAAQSILAYWECRIKRMNRERPEGIVVISIANSSL